MQKDATAAPGREATGRATLAPVERAKGGKTYWAARGFIPIREPDGTVSSRRIERGFGVDAQTAREREALCARWNAEYEERFRNPRKFITFSRAYSDYCKAGHPVPLKGEKILAALGLLQCEQIDDSTMLDLAEDLWPDGAAPGTVNRHLYTPVVSILHMALKEKAPELVRPKGHDDVHPVVIPPLTWYRELRPELNPSQLAFVATLAMHGRRTNEMLSRKPQHLDVEAGILDLGKTKTGIRELVLEPRALALITAIPGWRKRTWLFGAGPNSDNSFRRDLHAACDRVGLKWYHPHSFGRHMSVTRMLRAGYSVAHVADAHGMTSEMVTKRYGHLTKRETTAALHAVGGELYEQVFSGGNAGEIAKVGAGDLPPSDLKLLENARARIRNEMLPSEGDTLSS